MNETSNQVSEREKPFILPSRVLNLLGGTLEEANVGERKVPLVREGAYLWGTPDLMLPKAQGVFDHSCRVGRGAWFLALALRERSLALGDGRYSNLNPGIAAEAGVVHDGLKIHSGEDKPDSPVLGRENLTEEEKRKIGLPPGYREISEDADLFLIEWLKKGNFPPEVIKTVVGHDFPASGQSVETPYQELITWADYCCGYRGFIGTEGRLEDVFDRWIKLYVVNIDEFVGLSSVEMVVDHWRELRFGDKRPRIEPERAANSAKIIRANRDRLFGYLGMTEDEFIKNSDLNYDIDNNGSELKMPPWERVLRNSRKSDERFQESGGEGSPRSDKVKGVVQRKVG